MYLELNVPLKHIDDQESIILGLAECYCNKGSECKFDRFDKTLFLRGSNGVQKQYGET